MKDFEDTIDGLATVALALYLAVVVIRGNLKPFLAEVVKDAGFLEWLVALFILYEVTRIPTLKPYTAPLFGMAGLILAMRLASGSNQAAFSRFASGQIGLYEFASTVFGTQA